MHLTTQKINITEQLFIIEKKGCRILSIKNSCCRNKMILLFLESLMILRASVGTLDMSVDACENSRNTWKILEEEGRKFKLK